ncbi:MAG: MarR family transcriptional regulator [Bacteroidaceae bacterium]|nr:MarR family transcriptional regulator [Bacteroidaceae bacterium]
MLNRKPHVAVVGAANIDITASANGKYIPCDSCPGSVAISYGGVGRNIAHNLVLMGCEVSLLTAFGEDEFALGLMRDCERLNLDIHHSTIIAGQRSSMYVCVNDENGEVVSAVSAMDINDSINPKYIEQHIDFINSCDAVVLEANIPSETIAYIFDNCNVPVFADTVSTAKSHRIFDVISSHRPIHSLKMNRIEAMELSGEDESSLEILDMAANVLHNKGVKRVYITLGSLGSYYHDKDGGRLMPCPKVEVVNTSGAGDAFLSGVVLAFLNGLDIESTNKCAVRAAAITVQCGEAVNPLINEYNILYE